MKTGVVGGYIRHPYPSVMADARVFNGVDVTSNFASKNSTNTFGFPLTMEEFKGKTKIKWLGDLEALKSFPCDNLKSVIYLSLTDIFNHSISSGVFPDDWKVAKDCPLLKSGERNDANNYRPISVLPSIARVFERLLY